MRRRSLAEVVCLLSVLSILSGCGQDATGTEPPLPKSVHEDLKGCGAAGNTCSTYRRVYPTRYVKPDPGINYPIRKVIADPHMQYVVHAPTEAE